MEVRAHPKMQHEFIFTSQTLYMYEVIVSHYKMLIIIYNLYSLNVSVLHHFFTSYFCYIYLIDIKYHNVIIYNEVALGCKGYLLLFTVAWRITCSTCETEHFCDKFIVLELNYDQRQLMLTSLKTLMLSR